MKLHDDKMCEGGMGVLEWLGISDMSRRNGYGRWEKTL